MGVSRFFVSPQAIHGSTLTIDDPRELHHITGVLRLNVGDRLVCFDGQGSDYVGTITQRTTRQLIVRIDRRTQREPSHLTLWLAQGLPKADRFDWVVQKATELGVGRVSPLITRHTVVRLTPEQGRTKRQRWQRIAQEAAKQCGRTTIPAIDPPQPLETFVRLVEGVALMLMPTLAVTTIPLEDVLKSYTGATEVAVLIGPEGDFSREEVSLAERYGARPVSLGPLTLRSETAALATLAILRYVLGS